jgi:Leucine-rich repeat (LRR) protein
MANNRPLKAYVRFDGSGRIVAGSLILRKNKPKVGKWKEIPAYECCNAPVVTFNFDVTADWSLTTPNVIDAATFKIFLESGQDGDGNTNNQTGVVVTDFLLVGNRLRCNVSSTGGGDLGFAYMGVTDVTSFGNLQMTADLYLYSNNISSVDNTSWPIGVISIDLGDNNITSFDNVTWPSTLTNYLGLYQNPFTSFNPSVALPSGITAIDLGGSQLASFDPTLPLPSSLQYLYIHTTQLTAFDPSIALPSGLLDLDLSNNLLTSFDPSIALPTLLLRLYLNNNQIVNFNPTIALPSSLQELVLDYNQIVTFNPAIALPSGLQTLSLSSNQMTTAGYTASEPWANAMSVIPGRGSIFFYSNPNSVSGTNLETILISKGWSIYV